MEKTSYDCVILVVGSRGEIYDKLINNYWSHLITYIKKTHSNIKIYMIFGNDVKTDDLNLDNDNKLILNIKECLIPGMLIKTLLSFKYIEENYTYKHIFRTNLSSFIILRELININKNLDSKDIYAGIIGECNGTNFISGAGCWLSRDNIVYILNNLKYINLNIIEDVSIGMLLKNKKKTFLKRYDLTDNNNISDKQSLLNKIITDNHYHIRIKNFDRNIDLDYMDFFTNALYRQI